MKKKVLFVVNHFRYSGGVSTVLLNLISNLDINKYDIHLLSIYTFDEEFAAPILNRITVIRGFNFYFRGLDKIIDLIPGDVLYHFFVKEKYDLEIAFQYGVPTRMIAMGDNPNRICWMHTYDSEMVQKQYYEKYRKIITVAKVGRDKLLKEGFAENNTEYCYNIIDEVAINKAAMEDIGFVPSNKNIVITVARLNPDKAFMRYLECINNISNRIDETEFWIVGDGSEYSQMKEYIDKNNLGSVVRLLGLQKNPYKFMSKATLYFCASYREGFSTSCQEAAILGLPVISVDVDGAQELNTLSNCGSVIPNDLVSMETELIRVLNEEETINHWKKTSELSKTAFYKAERIKKAEAILDEYLF